MGATDIFLLVFTLGLLFLSASRRSILIYITIILLTIGVGVRFQANPWIVASVLMIEVYSTIQIIRLGIGGK